MASTIITLILFFLVIYYVKKKASGSGRKLLENFPSADELDRMATTAQVEVAEKWLQFNQQMKFQDGVSLSQRIDSFAQPIQVFMSNKYPPLMLGPGKMFWMVIFNAIIKSGTHPVSEVNAAVDELGKKYSGQQ